MGALTSATKSSNVKSVSCPIAEIIRILLLYAALITISSLKPHKSSIEPPPLAMIITSGFFSILLNPVIALATSDAVFTPCTVTGHTIISRGYLSEILCKIS